MNKSESTIGTTITTPSLPELKLWNSPKELLRHFTVLENKENKKTLNFKYLWHLQVLHLSFFF